MLQPKTKAILQMLICSTLWSSGGILIKLVPWNSFVVSGARSFVAMLTIALFMLSRRQTIQINKRTLSAGVSLCLTYTCFVAANKLTTAANAIVLQFTSPLFLMLMSAVFLRQRIRRSDTVATVCTLAGVALCFFDQLGSGGLIGNIVAIMSGLCMASMFLLVGRGQGGTERLSSILIGQAMTAVLGIPFAIAMPPALMLVPVLSILALGVVQIGIAYILYGLAAERCPPLACCLLGAVEPLLNPVWVFLFNGERPGLLALVGGVLVVTTVTAWCIYGGRASEKQHEQQA